MSAVATPTRKAAPKAAPKVNPAKVPAQPPASRPSLLDPDAWEHVIGDIMCRHEVAQALVRKFAEENAVQPGALGVLALAETLEARIAKICDSTPGLNDHLKGVFPSISADYLIAVDVALAVNAQCEDSLMWAAMYLMDDCKDIVDKHISDLKACNA